MIQYVRLTDSQAKAPLSFATLVLNLVEDRESYENNLTIFTLFQ